MLKYQKIREVSDPTIGYDGDAGHDLYLPKLKIEDIKVYEGFIEIDEDHNLIMSSNARVKIPLGLRFDFREYPNTCLMITDKSGIATEKGAIALAKIIDIGYTGEAFFSVTNISTYRIKIEIKKSLVQVLHLPIIPAEWQEVDDIGERETERGNGCLGSSN